MSGIERAPARKVAKRLGVVSVSGCLLALRLRLCVNGQIWTLQDRSEIQTTFGPRLLGFYEQIVPEINGSFQGICVP